MKMTLILIFLLIQTIHCLNWNSLYAKYSSNQYQFCSLEDLNFLVANTSTSSFETTYTWLPFKLLAQIDQSIKLPHTLLSQIVRIQFYVSLLDAIYHEINTATIPRIKERIAHTFLEHRFSFRNRCAVLLEEMKSRSVALLREQFFYYQNGILSECKFSEYSSAQINYILHENEAPFFMINDFQTQSIGKLIKKIVNWRIKERNDFTIPKKAMFGLTLANMNYFMFYWENIYDEMEQSRIYFIFEDDKKEKCNVCKLKTERNIDSMVEKEASSSSSKNFLRRISNVTSITLGHSRNGQNHHSRSSLSSYGLSESFSHVYFTPIDCPFGHYYHLGCKIHVEDCAYCFKEVGNFHKKYFQDFFANYLTFVDNSIVKLRLTKLSIEGKFLGTKRDMATMMEENESTFHLIDSINNHLLITKSSANYEILQKILFHLLINHQILFSIWDLDRQAKKIFRTYFCTSRNISSSPISDWNQVPTISAIDLYWKEVRSEYHKKMIFATFALLTSLFRKFPFLIEEKLPKLELIDKHLIRSTSFNDNSEKAPFSSDNSKLTSEKPEKAMHNSSVVNIKQSSTFDMFNLIKICDNNRIDEANAKESEKNQVTDEKYLLKSKLAINFRERKSVKDNAKIYYSTRAIPQLNARIDSSTQEKTDTEVKPANNKGQSNLHASVDIPSTSDEKNAVVKRYSMQNKQRPSLYKAVMIQVNDSTFMELIDLICEKAFILAFFMSCKSAKIRRVACLSILTSIKYVTLKSEFVVCLKQVRETLEDYLVCVEFKNPEKLVYYLEFFLNLRVKSIFKKVFNLLSKSRNEKILDCALIDSSKSEIDTLFNYLIENNIFKQSALYHYRSD